MSILQAVMTAPLMSGGPPSVAWSSISYSEVLEGQLNAVYLDFNNWDDSLVYWYLTNGSSVLNSGQVTSSGQFSPGLGNNIAYPSFSFTFASDATTEGPLLYYIRVENASGNLLLPEQGPFACIDSSQTPTQVLNLDPASLGSMGSLTVWYDDSGLGNNQAVINGTKSSDNGGTLVFGVGTYVADWGDRNITNATYGTITLSAWIKPTSVTNGLQTIIAKELCYKLRINGDGTVTFSTGKGSGSWEVTATVSAGAVTAGAWAHVVATSDNSYTRIYVNGVKIAETTGNIIGTNATLFNIGTYESGFDQFVGSMGQIKMWNYALTESLVVTEYNTDATRYGLSVIP